MQKQLVSLWIAWILGIIITLSAAVYQRLTGPTHPKRTKVEINDNTHKFKLPRSNGESDCEVSVSIDDNTVSASLFYRRFPTNEAYQELKMQREGENLIAMLPQQPPAGKLQYYLEFSSEKEVIKLFKENPVKIRFKGDVPLYILAPHVLFMFLAMLLSNVSALTAAFGNPKFRFYAKLTFFALLIGGMILGPVVQLFAFGELWTGFPNGKDLTDNKTLFAFLFWILAFIMNLKKPRPVYVIIASIVLLMIYSIPHSMMGSELDPETGKIMTGMINFLIY